jgi:tripartite-type tricarboxylate transporter receptor subunit TctC
MFKFAYCRRVLAVAVLAFITGGTVVQSNAIAQATAGRVTGFPDKSIRLLVGNAPGGGSDITARIVAEKLTGLLGHPVIVDNRSGASGIIAMNLAAQAPANGYTLQVVAGADLAGAMAQKKLAFDVRAAYAPISQLTAQYYLLLAAPSLPVGSLKELIEYVKGRPGALTFGSAGIGSAGHAGLEFWKSLSGLNIVHVPYKGIAPALTDMIGGQLHLAFVSTISGVPHVSSGRLRALAVTSARRAQAFSDLPTVAEAGAAGFDLTNWYGFFAPAGTPQSALELLFRAATQALNSPDLQSRFAASGAEAAPSASSAEFAQLLAKEVAKWEKIMQLPGFAQSLQ